MAGCGRVHTMRAGGIEASVTVRERYAGKSRDLGRKVGRQAAKS